MSDSVNRTPTDIRAQRRARARSLALGVPTIDPDGEDPPRARTPTDELIVRTAEATADAIAEVAEPCVLVPRVVSLEAFRGLALKLVVALAAGVLGSLGTALHSIAGRAAAEEGARVRLDRALDDIRRLTDDVHALELRRSSAYPTHPDPAGGLPVSIAPRTQP